MKRNVLEYLEHSANTYLQKTAVIDERIFYTYGDLLELSKRIGSGLSSKTKLGKPIAVLARKSSNTLATFLGIVQAGGFYVLLNPELPIHRLRQIQSVLQAEILIVDEEHQDLAKTVITENDLPEEIQILEMETLMRTEINQNRLDSIRCQMIDTNPLYANFTSGSTGVPKGVVVGHRSVLDFIDVFSNEFGIDETDIIGNQAPFDFDVSVKDIYTALKTGARLVIIPRELFSNPSVLLDFIWVRSIKKNFA